MTIDRPAFNLLDERWVKVRALSGAVQEYGLLDLFERAQELRGLAGELPTQDVAILRLLEAALLGATRPSQSRSRDQSLDLWANWWSAGQFPAQIIRDYLESHRNRFNLLDPAAPFLQVADLHTASGKASGLIKLIADVPDGHQYFTTRAGRELESLSYSEAARWLIHCHAYDCAGIKTGAVGDERVKGGKGYSMGYPAWAGNLGVIIAEGSNLFETLMLNLPLSMARPDDIPVWERSPLTACIASDHPAPLGPADAFSWPSRRVRLHPRDGRIVDVQISNGDRLGPQHQQKNEPMTSWKKSQNQSKGGVDVYMPVTHSPEKRIWQGLGSLLLRVEGVSLRAPALDWLDSLRYNEILPKSYGTTLRAVGIEYGAQASSIVGVVDDGLHVHVAAITDLSVVQVAVDAAARASQGVVALVNLASNLELAAGGDAERPRERTFELGYSLLDGPYREWLSGLQDAESAGELLDAWGERALRILRDTGAALVAEAGREALIGRELPKRGTDTMQWIDSALAELWFRAAVSKALVSKPTTVPQEVAS
jgi:CRISPR system Cascade subunit CasA